MNYDSNICFLSFNKVKKKLLEISTWITASPSRARGAPCKHKSLFANREQRVLHRCPWKSLFNRDKLTQLIIWDAHHDSPILRYTHTPVCRPSLNHLNVKSRGTLCMWQSDRHHARLHNRTSCMSMKIDWVTDSGHHAAHSTWFADNSPSLATTINLVPTSLSIKFP